MTRDDVINEYFDWLYGWISKKVSYRKLMMHLHNIEFTYLIEKDENRAVDGINMRWRFACEEGYRDVPDCLDGPCSVFEMMIAVAIKCEEDIMDDPGYGDRTAQWFWSMITSLGLGSMNDRNYDKRFVDDVITRFLDREYEPDGRGGLFTIRNCDCDLRTIEIFYQMCRYLNTIT